MQAAESPAENHQKKGMDEAALADVIKNAANLYFGERDEEYQIRQEIPTLTDDQVIKVAALLKAAREKALWEARGQSGNGSAEAATAVLQKIQEERFTALEAALKKAQDEKFEAIEATLAEIKAALVQAPRLND